ncbi:MAG TPA: DUF4097 family beta strand repeat-containing protein [Thermoanaerobaculia bacterium]|nr:DUF4097 family beta strand repeat-containing protein [Thermoanaerobaculia bacterium]
MQRRPTSTAPTLLAAALTLALATTAGAATLTQTIDRTLPLRAGSELVVRNVNGPVTLGTWDRDEVRLVAVKRVKAGSESAAREGLEALEVDIEQSADGLRIETDQPRHGDGLFSWATGTSVQYEVRYTLTVPRSVRLDASTVNGSVKAEGLAGEIRLGTVNGGVHVRDTRGALEAHTTNGAIDAELVQVTRDARLAFTTTNGSIDLALPSDVRGRLQANTTNGSISSDFPVTVEGRYGPKSVRGDLNGGGHATLKLATTNGGIKIRRL